ncbi:hypothetical protein TKV_c07560 [Thermoanaerobacter kivui]|uniref:Uncharacterized protein n=2 Tax=Thermoanaerobacter kivui TaxID=2325 RepID=A0A097AQ31_THEKI|nr:hypothetical protein TKV_c07560 [Thermoanaerobacter kivui]
MDVMKNSDKKNYYVVGIISGTLTYWLTKNINSYLSLVVAVLIGFGVGYLYRIISEFIENKKHKK